MIQLAMRLLVGLGNPGERYEKTRHNVGFLILDELKNKITNDQLSIINQDNNFQYKKDLKSEILNLKSILLAKPQTFMNDSGVAVSKILNFYSLTPSDLYVVHDDLDIELGEYKIQFGKGPKVHNGVNSIEEHLGTHDFWRVRIGIENRHLEIQNPNTKIQKTKGQEYVLQKFAGDEFATLQKVITVATKELLIKIHD